MRSALAYSEGGLTERGLAMTEQGFDAIAAQRTITAPRRRPTIKQNNANPLVARLPFPSTA